MASAGFEETKGGAEVAPLSAGAPARAAPAAPATAPSVTLIMISGAITPVTAAATIVMAGSIGECAVYCDHNTVIHTYQVALQLMMANPNVARVLFIDMNVVVGAQSLTRLANSPFPFSFIAPCMRDGATVDARFTTSGCTDPKFACVFPDLGAMVPVEGFATARRASRPVFTLACLQRAALTSILAFDKPAKDTRVTDYVASIFGERSVQPSRTVRGMDAFLHLLQQAGVQPTLLASEPAIVSSAVTTTLLQHTPSLADWERAVSGGGAHAAVAASGGGGGGDSTAAARSALPVIKEEDDDKP